MVFDVVSEILVLVVVGSFGRFDANQRQGITADHRRRQFLTCNKFLGDYQGIELVSELKRGDQIARCCDFGNADTGALTCWLHNQRQLQFLNNSPPVAMRSEHAVSRCWNAGGLPDEFGSPFVHRQRRAHHAGTGVGNLQGFKYTLHGAVFSEAAMQRDEYAIKFLARQIKQRIDDWIEGVRIHALLAQRSKHAAPGEQRDFALSAWAAHQHGNFAEFLCINTQSETPILVRLSGIK